jgi:hypothetical protein
VYQELKTKEGTLVVDVSGDVDVRYKNGELQIYGDDGKLKYTLKLSERNAKLATGHYTVKVKGADGVELETPEFTMTKNGEVILRVKPKPANPPIPGPDLKPDNPQKSTPSPKPTDREAAEYVLSVGGIVRLNSELRECQQGELPKEPFQLTWVALDQNQRVTDQGLAVFDNCKDLEWLSLAGCPNVTDAGLAHFRNCAKLEFLSLAKTRLTGAGLSR